MTVQVTVIVCSPRDFCHNNDACNYEGFLTAVIPFLKACTVFSMLKVLSTNHALGACSKLLMNLLTYSRSFEEDMAGNATVGLCCLCISEAQTRGLYCWSGTVSLYSI